MKIYFCDRCNRALPTIKKKKFFGLIDYSQKDKIYSMWWENEKLLCGDCGRELNKWLNIAQKSTTPKKAGHNSR